MKQREKSSEMLNASLPERCHGHDGIPECLWNAGEIRILNSLLSVVHNCSKYNDGH